jgi:lactoylglutathione lyase
MPTYTYDPIHLRSRDPMETARYYNKMFDAEIIESVQPGGQPRIDLNINGLTIFIAHADENTPSGLVDPHLGLDHFGLRVDNLDVSVAELKERGAEFAVEPHELRPGLRIAFVRTPDDVRIELLERT